MSFFHPKSSECAKSEFEVFGKKPTQTSVEETRVEPFYPLTSVDGSGPLEFKITAGSDEWIDPNNTWLYIKAKIVDETGQHLAGPANDEKYPNTSMVFPVNNLMGTMFSRIEILLNSTPLPTTSLYPYRSYLETLMSYPKDVKDSILAAKMWYDDNVNMGCIDVHAEREKNKGAKSRFERTAASRSFEGLSKIHHELFEQPLCLVNKVNLTIRLHRNEGQFMFMAKTIGQRYKLSIEKAQILTTIKKVAAHLREAIEKQLLTENAQYDLQRTEMKFFTKGSGRSDISVNNLCNGTLPKLVLIGMVETDAFNGHYQKNPFQFKNFSVKELALQKNGMNVPFKPLHLNFTNNEDVLMGYFELMLSLGFWYKDKSNGIRLFEDFCRDKCLYAVNLTQDFCTGIGGHENLIQEGSLSLNVSLDQALAESVTIIVYLLYPTTTLEINSQREIFYNE